MDSNIVRINNGFVKLNDGINRIHGYYLNKGDFFSTERIIVLSEDGGKLPSRRVYKYLSMQEPDFSIDTKSFHEKMELYLSKQIKIRNFSKAQQREMKKLFVEILSNYESISEFFEENRFEEEDLHVKISNVSSRSLLYPVVNGNNNAFLYSDSPCKTTSSVSILKSFAFPLILFPYSIVYFTK